MMIIWMYPDKFAVRCEFSLVGESLLPMLGFDKLFQQDEIMDINELSVQVGLSHCCCECFPFFKYIGAIPFIYDQGGVRYANVLGGN
mgnify:CR=1 FL=1